MILITPTPASLLALTVLCLSNEEVIPPAAKPNAPPLAAGEPTRIQVDVTRVSMLFTVTDKKGRTVTNLRKDDFEVIESKQRQFIQEAVCT
jgi:hypothetical protein